MSTTVYLNLTSRRLLRAVSASTRLSWPNQDWDKAHCNPTANVADVDRGHFPGRCTFGSRTVRGIAFSAMDFHLPPSRACAHSRGNFCHSHAFWRSRYVACFTHSTGLTRRHCFDCSVAVVALALKVESGELCGDFPMQGISSLCSWHLVHTSGVEIRCVCVPFLSPTTFRNWVLEMQATAIVVIPGQVVLDLRRRLPYAI